MEPLHKFFFHTMEFHLSRSLFKLFLHTMEFSAITEPSQTFLSHDGIFGYHEAFSNFSEFSVMMGFTRHTNLGEDSFHIYRKEYLHRVCLVKNLAS
jgi:hypothetical protein